MAVLAAIYARALDLASDAYKNNVRIAAQLDDKAQKASTVAGLFPAAAFAFLKAGNVGGLLAGMGVYAIVIFIATMAVFICCLAACLSVMWIRRMPAPLAPALVNSMNDDLLVLQDEDVTDRMQANHYREQVLLWMPIIDGQITINKDKARRLWLAQVLLGSGMLSVSALFTVALLHG
jgi:hypothetical protein